MTTAGAKLASTCEIIEQILRDVFAQRVSKTWRAVVQHSQQLQQTLFFTPINVGNGPIKVVSDSMS